MLEHTAAIPFWSLVMMIGKVLTAYLLVALGLAGVIAAVMIVVSQLTKKGTGR